MKKELHLFWFYAPLVLIGLVFFVACQDPIYESSDDEILTLKKGNMPTDVDQGDLYGDLWELQRDNSGVPILYELKYRTDYQDQVVEGIIDVINPKLDASFTLNILQRDEDGYVLYNNPTDGTDPVPLTEEVTIDPGPDNFLNLTDDGYSPIVLFDAEGEILADVALHVFPIEEGRLNIIRSPSAVLSRRIAEVIKNFGDGTVAEVIRDFCGRLYMVRTDAALALGSEDKPIDSPLENLAIYNELMLYGLSRLMDDNGLNFLVEPDANYGGFNFQSRLDGSRWSEGALHYPGLSDTEKRQFVENLAASCVASGSDKSNFLTIDEIVFLNLFMGIPKPVGNDIDKPADNVISFFPYVEQEVRMMDKTDKHQYSKFRYYIDYSGFSYTRDKFEETFVDFWSIILTENGYEKVLMEPNISLHTILTGESSLPDIVIAEYRYTQEEGQPISGALGFASQADDYVQALEVVHNNEEFLVWQMPTPTWGNADGIVRTSSPFSFTPTEVIHSRKPEDKGDSTTGTSPGSGSGSGRDGRH